MRQIGILLGDPEQSVALSPRASRASCLLLLAPLHLEFAQGTAIRQTPNPKTHSRGMT